MTSQNNLQGLKVLVTRPQPQAQALAQSILQAGGQAIIFSCIEIVTLEDQTALDQTIAQLSNTDIAIFISPNAVALTAPKIQQVWPHLPKQLKISCIGEGTAKALYQYHFNVDFFPKQRFNSEGLLELPELKDVQGKRIILFKGLGGKEILATELKQRGALVTEAIAYQRKLPNSSPHALLEKLQTNDIEVITCTSNEVLQNLVTLIGNSGIYYLRKLPMLVISNSIYTQAKLLGITNLILASSATDEAIITTLNDWKKRNKYGEKVG